MILPRKFGFGEHEDDRNITLPRGNVERGEGVKGFYDELAE